MRSEEGGIFYAGLRGEEIAKRRATYFRCRVRALRSLISTRERGNDGGGEGRGNKRRGIRFIE